MNLSKTLMTELSQRFNLDWEITTITVDSLVAVARVYPFKLEVSYVRSHGVVSARGSITVPSSTLSRIKVWASADVLEEPLDVVLDEMQTQIQSINFSLSVSIQSSNLLQVA
jgi:hypothetical protein